jgi:hypothetical protein
MRLANYPQPMAQVRIYMPAPYTLYCKVIIDTLNTAVIYTGNEESSRMSDHPVNRWSGFVPLMMSLVALLAVAKAVVNFRQHGPPLSEDGPWHVFMSMIFLQLPIILYFIFRSRREFRRALPILAMQLSLWAICLGDAYYFPGMY